jgi:hypothetical protein
MRCRKSYREHFAGSHFTDRLQAIAAYDAADPAVRDCLDMLAGTITAVVEATRDAMRSDLPPLAACHLAQKTAAALKPLVARAGAVINGDAETDTGQFTAPQAVIDRPMNL